LPEMPLTSSTTMCPRATRFIVVALLTFIGGLLFAAVRQESQTVGEACHLFVGFAYWSTGSCLLQFIHREAGSWDQRRGHVERALSLR
jgi:hypothetical protein